MRKIEPTTAFKRDFKREGKGPHRALLDTELKQVITALANDVPLAPKHRDHALTGNWKNYRDCHVRTPRRGHFFGFLGVGQRLKKGNTVIR
jgi:mRNA interferase YafQ